MPQMLLQYSKYCTIQYCTVKTRLLLQLSCFPATANHRCVSLCHLAVWLKAKVKRETRAKAKAKVRPPSPMMRWRASGYGQWILRLVFKLLLCLAEALEGSEVNPFLSIAKLLATMIPDLHSSLVQSHSQTKSLTRAGCQIQFVPFKQS